MRCQRNNLQVIIILACSVLLFHLIDFASCQDCRDFRFEKSVDTLYFSGDFEPSNSEANEGENSIRILEADPDNKREVSSSIEFNSSSGSIMFFWKRNGTYANFFDLSFYFDDKFIDKCNNINNWGNKKFFHQFQSDGKSSHTIKWVLKHGDKNYVGTPPTSDAFIDGFEMCNIRFKGETFEGEPFTTVEQETNDTSSLYVVKDYIKLDQDNDRNLQESTDMIKMMQNNGNYTIKTLILTPREYSLNNRWNLEGLKDLSIECENYEDGNLAIINISSEDLYLNIENCTNVDIKGLEINNGLCGIYLNKSNKCEISKNKIIDSAKCGIALDGSSENIIKNNKISSRIDRSTGINLINASLNEIQGNSISVDNECYNIKFESKENNIIDNNSNGLISIFEKVYEICNNNGGFKERDRNEDCSIEKVCDNNNRLKRMMHNE